MEKWRGNNGSFRMYEINIRSKQNLKILLGEKNSFMDKTGYQNLKSLLQRKYHVHKGDRTHDEFIIFAPRPGKSAPCNQVP